MAIKPVTMYAVVCNECDAVFECPHIGYTAFISEDKAAEEAQDAGWQIAEAKCRKPTYCPTCTPNN